MGSARPISAFFAFFFLVAAFPQGAPGQDSKENADFKLAVNLFHDGLHELAAEQFTQFIGSYPNTVQGTEARFFLGQAQMHLGRLEEARLTFQTFALTYQDNPNAPEAWNHVGEIYAALGNHRESALAYERVKVFHPRSPAAPEALVRAGRQFSLAGMPDDARRVLRAVLQEYPASGATHGARTALAELYFMEGQIVQARNELMRVIEGDPSLEARAQALLILGDIYRAQWLLDEAAARYDEVIQKHGNSSAVMAAHVRRGQLLNMKGEHAGAVTSFRKVLEEQSLRDSSLLWEAETGLGVAYDGVGDYDRAISQFERLYRSRPDPEVLWLITVAASRAGDHNRVVQSGGMILSQDPPDLLKRKTIGLLAEDALADGNYGEALRMYTMFLEVFPGDPAGPATLLRAAIVSKEKMRDLRRSALYCEAIISRFPRSPEAVQAHLVGSECYEGLDDFDRAIELRHALAENYPSAGPLEASQMKAGELTTFQQKDKDAALERLALLIGDVAAGQQQQDIAFRLGQTYFENLKNYEAAADQFTLVISSGLTDRRFEEALLYRARSYEYLSWRDPSFRSRAVDSYTTFLKSYHADPRADDVALSLFELQASSASAAREAYTSVTALYPGTTQQGAMLLKIGKLDAEKDSLRSALRAFERVLREYPSSQAAEEARFGRFEALSKLGISDSAMVEGERYVNQYPSGSHTAHVLFRLGTGALKAGEAERASRYFSTLVGRFEYADDATKGRKDLARSYAMQGDYQRSVGLYEKLLTAERANPFRETVDGELLLGAADAYRHAGRSKDARKMLFETVAGGAGRGEAFAALGMLAKEDGDPALATSYFRMSAAVNPAATTTREIADLMFESGAYEDAITKYKRLAVSDVPERDVRYFQSRMIASMIRAGQMKGAEKEIALFDKRYDKTDPEMGSFELEKGNHYFRNNQFSNARSAYAVVLNKYDDTPSAPDAMYWRGKSMEAEGKMDDAAKQYEEILEDYPDAPIALRAHLGLGNIGYHKEEWDNAVRHYRYVVESPMADDELLPFAMSNLIETYDAAGVYDAALDLSRRYLDRYPANEDSFDKKIKIGILYQRLGYHDQSVVHLQGLLDQAGSDLEGEIRYYIAEGNFNKGDFQQAILDFLKVPYLVSKKGKIDWTANSLYMAGQSYERLGKYDQALSMYKQIIDRQGIDETFKAAAKKEIDRVNLVIKGTP